MIYSFYTDRIPVLVNAYQVIRRTIWQIADPYYILLFITDGCCKIEYGTETYLLNCGDIFFLPANHSYTRYPVDNKLCTMIYLHFTVDSAPVPQDPQLLRQHLCIPQLHFGAQTDAHSVFYLQNHWKDCSSQITALAGETVGLFTRQLSFSANTQLLYLISQLSQVLVQDLVADYITDDDFPLPPKLSTALIFMESHIAGPLSLEQLCSHCGISKSQLNRYFKQYTGTTAMDYFIHLRLSRAKQLFLTMPWLSVKEVAGQLGYDDPQYFSRIFRQYFGETPSEYRYRVDTFQEESQFSAET